MKTLAAVLAVCLPLVVGPACRGEDQVEKCMIQARKTCDGLDPRSLQQELGRSEEAALDACVRATALDCMALCALAFTCDESSPYYNQAEEARSAMIDHLSQLPGGGEVDGQESEPTMPEEPAAQEPAD